MSVISGHDDYSIRKKHRTEGNRKEGGVRVCGDAVLRCRKEKQLQRPITRSKKNVADEKRSDLCGCLFSWYSKEIDGRNKYQSELL